MPDSEWSVRISQEGRYEYGGTGLPENLAVDAYQSFVERVRLEGGEVELLKDGQRVAFFSANPGGKPTP